MNHLRKNFGEKALIELLKSHLGGHVASSHSLLGEVEDTWQSLVGRLGKWIPRGSCWLDAELVADSRDTWHAVIGR